MVFDIPFISDACLSPKHVQFIFFLSRLISQTTHLTFSTKDYLHFWLSARPTKLIPIYVKSLKSFVTFDANRLEKYEVKMISEGKCETSKSFSTVRVNRRQLRLFFSLSYNNTYSRTLAAPIILQNMKKKKIYKIMLWENENVPSTFLSGLPTSISIDGRGTCQAVQIFSTTFNV